MLDLNSSRAFFTWTNKKRGGARVLSIIDRVMVNAEWGINLPASVVHYMSDGLFDHCTTIISWEEWRSTK